MSNASIRELARFHLGKLGEVDWPEVYRRALIEHPQSLAALSGLGETGDRSDLIAIRGCLDSPLPSRRRAAVRAFAKVGEESALPDLLRYLQDDSPAVIREVRKHLEASPSSLDGEWLCRVATEDHRHHVRETALRLINAMGKWAQPALAHPGLCAARRFDGGVCPRTGRSMVHTARMQPCVHHAVTS